MRKRGKEKKGKKNTKTLSSSARVTTKGKKKKKKQKNQNCKIQIKIDGSCAKQRETFDTEHTHKSKRESMKKKHFTQRLRYSLNQLLRIKKKK